MLEQGMLSCCCFHSPKDIFPFFPRVSNADLSPAESRDRFASASKCTCQKAWIRLLRQVDGERRRFHGGIESPGGRKEGGTRPPPAWRSAEGVGWKKPWLTQTKTLISLWERNLPAKAKEDFFFLPPLNKLSDKLLILSFSSRWDTRIPASLKSEPLRRSYRGSASARPSGRWFIPPLKKGREGSNVFI